MVPLWLIHFFSKFVSPSSLLASHPLLYMSTISPAFSLIIKGNPELITSLFLFDIRHYSKSLSCLLFPRPPAISLVSTSHQILFDWCEHYVCHNIAWNWYINIMINWDDYLLFFSKARLQITVCDTVTKPSKYYCNSNHDNSPRITVYSLVIRQEESHWLP